VWNIQNLFLAQAPKRKENNTNTGSFKNYKNKQKSLLHKNFPSLAGTLKFLDFLLILEISW